MRCPEAIHSAVCEILRIGALRARAAAWSGDAATSAVEVDHIHNLPDLLHDYSEARLEYYWNCERPAFLAQVGAANAREFQRPWDVLAKLVPEPADVD
jgi:hypothetical protein